MKRTTKVAIILSVLSLLVCITLLLGTTFAWFTDTAKSTANRIEAGSLEVKLLMDKAENGNYTDISNGNGDIFSETGNGIDWEPGKTEIVYLAVENAGSLDLKYNIVLNVTDSGIASALEYAIIDGAKVADLASVSDWESLTQLTNVELGDLDEGAVVTSSNNELLDTNTRYFALAIHMKEDSGNVYQNKSVEIDVTISATQLANESDSFGSDYDSAATAN